MAELAGIFLSPLLQAFFERVASGEFGDFFRRQKLDQTLLNNLKTALRSVNAVFEDAEEKQVTNPYVKEWLDELKDAVYDAEDILDEIDTEAMRCKLDAEFLTTTRKVRKAISHSLKVPFDKKIEPKIKEVLKRLKNLVEQKDVIGLKEGVRGKPSERLPTTPWVEESGICGRKDDKEKIINSMFSDDVSGNKMFHVIAIVGMGGLGKTTLAQLVFNDEKVNEYFDSKAWVCVSDDFDVVQVTKKILKGVSVNCDGETDLQSLQSKLKESLTGKKFLLVLDDVWNDKYMKWEALSKPFGFGAQGSRVLVTTREEKVVSVMQTDFRYNLNPLPEEECWSLFVRKAFQGNISDMHPELEEIGRQIVEKCKGLPLAVNTIGSLLWSKVDVEDWNRILKSEVWDMTTEIIPALRLSYTHLPSHLKRCFAYCSIYPKDHIFGKKELVSLWMAEGLLQKSKGKTMEQVGDDNIVDLVSRSLLFQESSTSSTFGMHDLVNDLARFVSGQFIFRLEGGNSLQVTNKIRHLSIVDESLENIPKTMLEALYEAKGLRTFLPITDDWNGLILIKKFAHDHSLPMFRFLRVLSFADDSNLTELPDSIGKIRHLRYLDLSWTGIRKLPDSICKLCNLQTLRLRVCENLTVLPRDMHKLISLRHLELGGSAITEMPLHLGRLKCLQTLDIFVVNKHCGSSIGELGSLEDIGGKLTITKLQNVKSPTDALDARLKDKKHLTNLELKWDPTTGNISESDQITVLGNLQPNTNLKSLTIDNYGGKSLPDWLAHPSFSKIVNLYLRNCKYCHILPSFGQLHSLQTLSIIGFHGIARVGMEFYGSGSSTFKPFEALKVLKFQDMPDWENWLCFDSENEGEATFPRLEALHIIKCPKLTGGLPIHLPSLARLEIVECSQLAASLPDLRLELINVNEVLLNELPSGFHKLVLKGSDALRSLPEGMMDSSSPLQELKIDGLPSTLKSLTISNCKKLEFPVHFNYSSLKELYLENSCDSLRCFHVNLIAKIDIFTINGCENLESLINSEQHENDLAASIIRIKNCPNFVSFPDGGLRAEKLKTFEISSCGNLRSLPDKMHLLLPSLESLSIFYCPMLQSFGEGGLPTNLKSLSIDNCPMLQSFGEGSLPTNLESLSIYECPMLQSFGEGGLPTNLKSLSIRYCPMLQSFGEGGLPTNLESLSIYKCPMLQSFGEGGLPTNLKSLSIKFCPMLQSFGEGGLPTNLESISIVRCDKLVACRTTWGLQKLPSLQELSIWGNCEDVKSFLELDLLPMTLTRLTISGFSNMTSLDGLQRLTSLEYMEIYNCPNLKFVPKDGFPASIYSLDIRGCPLLEKQLQNKKGKEWRKVAHIPNIEIGF
ncbi:putative disease resistance RPP13-like protein 1 isoform X2 [Carya illinoinensis]|uniref:putative disease resistance RPP13-like protein 1 isoform X2 n=1 Tax=Carya illinoinensis TaxID=32201 RepID=UPI001C722570|nr:putative disease resistance RPP13-like protein 1 isoform X2 [Carya illinoinensis]